MTATAVPPRRGRHRSLVADQAILAATLEELGSVGYGGLTMAAVIARSGVSSATLYRRWPTKQELVAAALASLHLEVADIDTGSLEGDVLELSRYIAELMSGPNTDLAEEVVTELWRNPEFRAAINERFHQPRVEQFEQILERARSRGELGPGISADVAMSFLGGALYNRRLMTEKPLSAAFVRLAAQGVVGALHAIAPPL